MQLVILGNGSMSQAIQRLATEAGHHFLAVTDQSTPWPQAEISAADLVIECSVPSACQSNIEQVLEQKKDLFIVTTGWYEQLPQVQALVEERGTRALYASNCSIGVALFRRVVQFSAEIFNLAPEYDIWATELHHHFKKDSPSGTAQTLGKDLIDRLERKSKLVTERLDRAPQPEELHFSSTRGGSINFSHTIGFDGAADTIRLEHQARNREGYAAGALQMMQWLTEQPAGFYSETDFFRGKFPNFF